MRLRKAETQQSYVRAPEEEERKRIPWGKYIYIGALAVLLLVIGSCVFRSVVYSSGTGVLRGKVMTVGSPRTGRIESVEVSVGEEVDAQQAVARMDLPEVTLDIESRRQNSQRQLRTVENRMAETRRELKLARKKKSNQAAVARELEQKLKLVENVRPTEDESNPADEIPDGLSEETSSAVQQLWVARQRTRNARNRVAEVKKELSKAKRLFEKGAVTGDKTQNLEARLADARRELQLRKIEKQSARMAVRSAEQNLRDRLEQARRELAVLKTNVSNLEEALQAARKERKQLRQQMKKARKLQDRLARQKILRAPDRGVVTWRAKKTGEVVKAGNPIVRIEQRKDLHLKTYFSLSQQPAVRTGTKVTVVFPGGERMTGRIRKIEPATASFQKEGLQNIKLREPRLLAEVVPVDGRLDDHVLGTEATVYLPRKWLSFLPGW